jgi:hypothetical protein
VSAAASRPAVPAASASGLARAPAEAVQGHGQHLVMADEHAELDQLGLAQLGGERRPGRIRDRPPGVQLVSGQEQQPLARREAVVVGPAGDGGYHRPGKPHPLGERDVLRPLVPRPAVAGRAEHHQLDVGPGQLAAQQQAAGQGEPPAEQPAVPGQGRQHPWPLTAGREDRRGRHQPGQQPQRPRRGRPEPDPGPGDAPLGVRGHLRSSLTSQVSDATPAARRAVRPGPGRPSGRGRSGPGLAR